MPYHPIDCNFYDELTLRAMRRTAVEIRYAGESGGEHTARAVVEDVFTRGEEEYMRLNDDQEIRLDRILAIDGLRSPGVC